MDASNLAKILDIQEEKKLFEQFMLTKGVDFKYLPNIAFNADVNEYVLIEDDEEQAKAVCEINDGWVAWYARAKIQVVPTVKWISVRDQPPKKGDLIIARYGWGSFADCIEFCEIDGNEQWDDVFFLQWIPYPKLGDES